MPLNAKIEIAWIEDGEHGFKPRRSSGRTLDDNLAQAAAATLGFIERLAGDRLLN